MAKDKIMEKLDSLFKEELWGRIEPKDIGISKFKILDDLFNSVVSEDIIPETMDACRGHLAEHADSITSMYLIGQIGYHRDNIEDAKQLRRLIEIFTGYHKWAVVELIAEKILEYGESSAALRAMALSLERLGRNKEAIPVLEGLLKIDRFDAELSKKLAFAIIDEEPDKSIHYMKLSIEGFIKNKKYEEVTSLWTKLVSVSWEDIAFFERIERFLVEAKQFELVASLLKILLQKYRDEQNPDLSLELLKKVLKYRPDDTHARRDLINLYRVKYGEHSQFEQFMKLSKLANYKTPVKYAIQDFEKNIVFDKGNYAYHNTWKLGKITDMDSENIVISFREKPEHKMSIQMALQSLAPIPRDHLYVMQYDDPEYVKNLFRDDFMQFFEILIRSYGGKILLEDVKRELIPALVPEKGWSKWWGRARTKIKRDPHYGFSEKKKDLIFVRDKPVTFAEELLESFTGSDSFSKKLDIAIEFVNNIDTDEGRSVVPYFIDYFTEEMKGDSATRQVLSYMILKDMTKFVDPAKLKLDALREKVIEFIKGSQELSLLSMKISSYDYKKDLVNLIEESREDWPQVLAELLFEIPVRIHKYIINNLIRAHAYNIINGFIDRVITGAKQYPEIFIWVARNIFSKQWDYDWLDYSRERLTVSYFRLMNELKKIELEGNRLKNMAIDVLHDNNSAALKYIAEQFDPGFLGKIYELFSNISYVEEPQKEAFLGVIKASHAGFQPVKTGADEMWEVDVEKLIVSREGYEKMKASLDRLVSVELVNISRELTKVADVSADIRENVEYNALMEKQATLELSISRLDGEMKKAQVLSLDEISTDAVNIGTRVILKEQEKGEERDYTILGPWDADFEKRILSYRSPIAKSLLGLKAGDVVNLDLEDGKKNYMIKEIRKYSA
ncbi:MAG TPA: transcription elongation factor GreA [Spirochaetota bacterium]|nr:transcription elongation factor GreA [Spirochaetota bacterium]HOD13553.1 transcription elongation factor GreA [Spirochaetota bacterium]HPG50516.1 transcription elongation factor GreA [Spirochaetota bacterium]HPN11809.1 transcription elongation factor GreA [Spirochaetota bacterium]HQL81068.1 transcription elongation factor GreA [Spirochaetota bacterium]